MVSMVDVNIKVVASDQVPKLNTWVSIIMGIGHVICGLNLYADFILSRNECTVSIAYSHSKLI